MNKNLITQKEMLRRANAGELAISVFPVKFNNGYFVKGTRKGSDVYATIRNEGELQKILNYQRGRN